MQKEGLRLVHQEYYQKDVAAALTDLKARLETGLDDMEVKRRLDEFGPNRLGSGDKASPWKIFLATPQRVR